MESEKKTRGVERVFYKLQLRLSGDLELILTAVSSSLSNNLRKDQVPDV